MELIEKSPRLLIEAGFLVIASTLLLRLSRFETVREILELVPRRHRARSSTSFDTEYLYRHVALLSQLIPGADTCLIRALAGKALLDRYGRDMDLRIGVRFPEADGLHAHAWLETRDGMVVGEAENISKFQPLDSQEDGP